MKNVLVALNCDNVNLEADLSFSIELGERTIQKSFAGSSYTTPQELAAGIAELDSDIHVTGSFIVAALRGGTKDAATISVTQADAPVADLFTKITSDSSVFLGLDDIRKLCQIPVEPVSVVTYSSAQ